MRTARNLDNRPSNSKGQDSQEFALDQPEKCSHTEISEPDDGLPTIMKLPVELFMELASHVHPGGLISLIRTNKFFRALLLDRSAAHVWQLSLSSVLELPPCPTAMVEPQYAALMFSDNCTLCGVQGETSVPDPYLRVRLCPNCRDEQLIRWSFSPVPSRYGIPFSQHTKPTREYSGQIQVYQLRAEDKLIERVENEFRRNGDEEGLAKWSQKRHLDWCTLCDEGDELLQYIYSVSDLLPKKLNDMKLQRRDEVHERLKDEGWSQKYLNIYRRSDHTIKKWRSLVEIPEPLTEQVWKGILPKLTELLKKNRELLDKHEWYLRQYKRRFKTENMLREYQRDTDPYRHIVDALQQPTSSAGPMGSIKNKLVLQAPFPCDMTTAVWACFQLYQAENTVERVEELFHERKGEIAQKLLEWRTQAENQLVEQYTSSFGGDTSQPLNAVLTVKGSTDATKDLSDSSRFLLRADTVFMQHGPYSKRYIGEVDQEHGPIRQSIHFPDIPQLQNYPHLTKFDWGYISPELGKYLKDYVRHIGKEVIVKALLRELDMPDAAHVELVDMGRVFVCGRCTCREVMEWSEIVEHYHLKRRDWVGGKFVPSPFTTKHPVVFCDIHDLEPGTNTQPLVCIHTGTRVSFDMVAHCLICRWIKHFDHCEFYSMEDMSEHMLKMHDSAEPVEGVHFMTESLLCEGSGDSTASLEDRVVWEGKWDEYHDARSAVNGETEA